MKVMYYLFMISPNIYFGFSVIRKANHFYAGLAEERF